MPINLVIKGKNILKICISCGNINFPEVAIKNKIPAMTTIINKLLKKFELLFLPKFFFLCHKIKKTIMIKSKTNKSFTIELRFIQKKYIFNKN